jgi:hypothetical protein
LVAKKMTRDDMLRHAEEWIAAWNRGDVERVLADFADDARFVSPRAALVTGSAVVDGKAAMGAYWRGAMAKFGPPRCRLDHVTCDTARNEMLVVYDRQREGGVTRACEIMRFDESGKQVSGEALYGAEIPISVSRA